MVLRDPVSSASHLFMAVWALFGLILLLRLTPVVKKRRLAVMVFGVSMALLFFASATFHAVPAPSPTQFRVLQRIDQSAIFVLIAGTNTPIMEALLGGGENRYYLGGIWSLAGAGIGCLWFLPRQPQAEIVAICLAMGWLGFLPLGKYYRAVGWKAMNWVWAGALLYTCGALCELLQWPTLSTWPWLVGFHEVFHLLSAAASLAFFLFIARYVVPYRRPQQEAVSTNGGHMSGHTG